MALAFLKELLGDAYTEQLDAKISEAVGKGFVAKAERDAAAQTALATMKITATGTGAEKSPKHMEKGVYRGVNTL